jgi:site-specific DNA-methyltransferase (adenine-specific)
MKKYKIIYADPPWAYKDKRDKHPRLCGGASAHYDTMSIADIKALPIQNIAAEDCMLFLWATFPNLQEALDLIKAWGFKYKTLGFSWIKTNSKNGKPFFGIGYYTKSNCEVCLIGVKGKPIKKSNKVSSVVIAPRGGAFSKALRSSREDRGALRRHSKDRAFRASKDEGMGRVGKRN